MQQVINSPLGNILLSWSSEGITELHFTSEALSDLTDSSPYHQANQQLQEYFDGSRRDFNLPLNPSGTPFQKKIWDELRRLNYGEACTYQELARRLEAPKSVRAVAAAIAKNPILLLIPCHRVLGKNGTLTGFSGALWRKKYLLEHEQNSYQTRLF